MLKQRTQKSDTRKIFKVTIVNCGTKNIAFYNIEKITQ